MSPCSEQQKQPTNRFVAMFDSSVSVCSGTAQEGGVMLMLGQFDNDQNALF